MTLTKEFIYQGFLGQYAEFKTFFHGHSYTGNQLGCAAALASLDVFRFKQTLANLQSRITFLSKSLDELFRKNNKIKDIRQCGFIAGVEICASRTQEVEYPFTDKMGVKLCLKMREKGVWIRPLGNTIVIVPPLITTEKEIEWLLGILDETLNEL